MSSLKTEASPMECGKITLDELQQHPLVKKFVEMPEEIYDSFSVSNPTMKLVVDTLRTVMNWKTAQETQREKSYTKKRVEKE